MSTSANRNDKGKTIVIESSSSDSESESTRAVLKNDKGEIIVIDSSSSDSESESTRIDLKNKGKRIVIDSSSSKCGSRFVGEDVDDDSHQVPLVRRKICGCFSRRPCSSGCPNLPMDHAPIVPPPQRPLVYSDNIQLSPNYNEQLPLAYSGNIYLSPEYYESARLRPVNPVASSSHQRAPRSVQGTFRPIAAQPISSSLQPPPHMQNLRAILMLQNHLNLDIDHMSYEELIHLGEVIGNVPNGLSEERIYELMRQSSYSLSSMGGSSEATESCVVCLESFRAAEDVGILNCGHKFHTVCIVPWLKTKNSCPICKAKALVGPDD